MKAACLEPMQYEWEKDGVLLLGEYAPELVVSNVGLAHTGVYRVRVRSGGLSAGTWSAAARVSVEYTPPRWVADAADVRVVGVGERLVLESRAEGNGTVRYRWRQNGAEVVGVSGSRLEVAAAGVDDGGEYTVEAFNEGGRVMSQTKRVGVLRMQRQPEGQTVLVGGSVVMSAGAVVSGGTMAG